MKHIYLALTTIILFSASTIFAQSGRAGSGTSAPKKKLDAAGAISTSERVLAAANSLGINISLLAVVGVFTNNALIWLYN